MAADWELGNDATLWAPHVISTLSLVLLGIFAICVAGYGPTLLLLERNERRSRAAAIPVMGLVCYMVATHVVASRHFDGRVVSMAALGALAALVFAVPKSRRLDRREIQDALAVFAICGAGMLLVAWPLLREGYGSYLAYGNPDVAFSVGVNHDLLRYAYGSRISDYPQFWPDFIFANVYGSGYIGVLLSVLTGANIFKLNDVVAAGMVFIVPAAVFLFATICLGATRKAALVAAAVAACSSQISYTFCLQSIGAMNFICLLPAFLALSTEALDGGGLRQFLATSLILAGASYGYYAALPIMGALLAVGAVLAFAKKTISITSLCSMAAICAGVAFVAYPSLMTAIVRRSVFEAGSSRMVASLNGPEIMLNFAFALTEQYLTFFWGLSIPTLATNSIFAPPSVIYVLVLGLGLLFSVTLVWLILRRGIRVEGRVQTGILAFIVAYYFVRNNAYGAFKLAGWFNPVFVAFLVCGILTAASFQTKRKWFARCAYGALLAMTVLNGGWTLALGRSSLAGNTGISGKNMAGFTAHDFEGLTELGKLIPPQERLLVAIPDAPVQRWVITYLSRRNISVVPFLSLSPEEADQAEQTAAAGADSARYILTWWKSRDIIPVAIQHPIWHNEKFQLARLDSASDLVIMGRGWYRTESIPGSAEPWQHRFRWLRTHGEMILLNGSGREMRLRLTLVSGYGQTSPERVVSFSLNGVQFDEVHVAGTANVITKPFRASGFLNRLAISVPDTTEPIPRKWGMIRRWVPQDGRRLNIAVSDAELIDDQQYSTMRLPCHLDFSRPDDWKVPGVDGLYGDRWIADEAHFALQPCGDADAVAVKGSLPGLPKSKPPFPVVVSVDGVPHTVGLTKPGPFDIAVAIPPSAHHDTPYEIAVWSERRFVPADLGIGVDRRQLSIQLDAIELRGQKGTNTSARGGIVSAQRSNGESR